MTTSSNITCFKDEKPDVEPVYKPEAPNFMRLFILHRILTRYVKQNNEKMSLFENCNLKSNYYESNVNKLVLSLLKYGIKIYMTDHYTETRDSQVIDLIFEKVIFHYFDKEYHETTRYIDKSDIHLEYSEKVFNTSDLMCLIFQFAFENGKDIKNINLVCSQWMYHSIDTKSYRYCHDQATTALMKIVDFNPKIHPKHELESFKSQLQRFYNVQSLEIHFPQDFVATSQFLSHLAGFNNVETFEMGLSTLSSSQLQALRVVTKNCKQLKCVKILTDGTRDAIETPVLILKNAQTIYMRFYSFKVVFSNKLVSLTVGDFEYSEYAPWLEFTIDNCDCCNIKHFKVDTYKKHNVIWFSRARTGDETTINLMKKFANKLVKLEKLELKLKRCHDSSIYIWSVFTKALEPICLKNGTSITSTRDLMLDVNVPIQRISDLL